MSITVNAFQVSGVPAITRQVDALPGSTAWMSLTVQNAGDYVTIAFDESVWRTINEDLTQLFAQLDAQAATEAAPAEPADDPDAWLTKGGYSPNGNSFGCPIGGCGWFVSGLDAEPDPEDAYAGDPVVEHYAESHADLQLAVDQAGTVTPVLEGVQPR